jgi:predicted glycoside hydrolase/deacetylase ChbG (UPF0249 family)
VPAKPIRLVTRGDDAGSSRSANLGILDACREGILRNVGIQVPGPAFDEAAEMFRDLEGVCLGLHATLTCEWNELRWGPVLGAAGARSLVTADGTFHQDTVALYKTGPAHDEILDELKAQIDLARRRGLDIRYMDAHMAFGWFDGLLPKLRALARGEGLLCGDDLVPGLPEVKGDFADAAERLLAQLGAAETGKTYLLVTHPARDTEEMRGLTYGQEPPGKIARERDGDRRLLLDPQTLDACRARSVQPIRFTDL